LEPSEATGVEFWWGGKGKAAMMTKNAFFVGQVYWRKVPHQSRIQVNIRVAKDAFTYAYSEEGGAKDANLGGSPGGGRPNLWVDVENSRRSGPEGEKRVGRFQTRICEGDEDKEA